MKRLSFILTLAAASLVTSACDDETPLHTLTVEEYNCPLHKDTYSLSPTSDLEFLKSKYLTHVTFSTFDKEVLQAKKPVIVDFYNQRCGPCKRIAPYYEQLAKEYPQLKFVKFDVDKDDSFNPNSIINTYRVNGLPAFRFFYKGKEYKDYALEGYKNAKLWRSVDDFLKELIIKENKK